MADHFLPGLENLRHSFNLPDFDPSSEFSSSFNPEMMNNDPTHLLENLFPHLLYQSSGNSDTLVPGLFIHEDNMSSSSSMVPHAATKDNNSVDRKRKAMEIGGRGRKVRGSNEKKEEKAEEVVQVRAKRGQATDSHSLAERVRRERINERIRYLQDIVPGCYKTMGMAVMLDEIINYVQSLQNQVEFLSMKLAAASAFYDFSSDSDALVTMQRPKAFEAFNVQEGANPGLISAQFAVPSFQYYTQLPHDR